MLIHLNAPTEFYFVAEKYPHMPYKQYCQTDGYKRDSIKNIVFSGNSKILENIVKNYEYCLNLYYAYCI